MFQLFNCPGISSLFFENFPFHGQPVLFCPIPCNRLLLLSVVMLNLQDINHNLFDLKDGLLFKKSPVALLNSKGHCDEDKSPWILALGAAIHDWWRPQLGIDSLEETNSLPLLFAGPASELLVVDFAANFLTFGRCDEGEILLLLMLLPDNFQPFPWCNEDCSQEQGVPINEKVCPFSLRCKISLRCNCLRYSWSTYLLVTAWEYLILSGQNVIGKIKPQFLKDISCFMFLSKCIGLKSGICQSGLYGFSRF